MKDKTKAQPLVKWAGGKRHLAEKILARLPVRINTYYEPFFGGGAVFFELAEQGRITRAQLNDTNEELMRAHQAVAFSPNAVISALKKHKYDEDVYYAVRKQNWRKLVASKLAARFIYLNRTCFNGLYRVNKKKGEFNVPFGRYTNPTICDAENLLAVGHVLRSFASVSWADFQDAVSGARKGDAVYFDPPYVPLTDSANFTAYTRDGFTLADQERLRDTAKRLIDRGVYVLLSNSDTPTVRKLYRGFKIEVVKAPRRVNSKASARGEIDELLISAGRRR